MTLIAPETVTLCHDTVIGADTVVEPNVFFGPGVSIGAGCRLRAGSYFEGASVGEGVIIGPMARLREGSQLDEGVKVGNFVEIKKAHLAAGAKAPHLTYVGDADVGELANLGAGHHHLQLRWREQAPDHHRRRCLHRVKRCAGRAGYHR